VDNELEVIRDEMEQTRANLAEKLGALENQVRETVSGATEAVNSTVEGVKGVVSSVSETVESVTDTFNVSKQVEQHPWMAVGAAVATGFVLAQVIDRSRAPAPGAPPAPAPAPEPPRAAATPQPGTPQPQQEHGLMHSLESMLPDMKGVMGAMVGNLGGLAVGGLMGVIRELAAQGLAEEWKGDVSRLIDQVTEQLGGKPLDSAHSKSLLAALGLDGLHGQGNGHGGQAQQRQEGVPSDAVWQQGGLYGTRGVPGAGRQPAQPR
jgi:ElaB/YqjD/DUF883 family membrane-anchored ribosome-binding protein